MFFSKHLKLFLLIGGIVTMLASFYFINPALALSMFNKLPYDGKYLFIIRHWGVMVGVMGFMIVLSAYLPSWRKPIMIFSFIEKSGMVFLYIENSFQTETAFLNAYFIPFALTDILIVTYTIFYWKELLVDKPLMIKSILKKL
ncbi:hypothetical protein KMW28_14715 [Flammeovirga yaeyamensis]|uniref:Uncharacterized protein n=1 Tax=Flammeovirga yaeyamensis TaxID=367791 RepID=A0AAX1N068_9BACT|nr:hypothetical protein [Flammeovirga yaeyamensis]MBB3700155.1 hypothetical protein [Flammeovirga yaeyamensis]NMF37215.1 hypothetical protein [Flammeovirga yaeyamensis]QWG00904.1 hypothetical protein KMW28_14715 [Flammeovirga yaeyamensis]